MKFYIFDTPGYTKKDWHSGRLILSRNGQTKGINAGSDGQKQVRRALAQVASTEIYDNPRARAKVTVNGVKMIVGDLIVGRRLAGQNYGGKENKEAARRLRHEKTQAALSGSTALAFRSTMGNEYEGF
jgi:hypothetical protein